jgi:hypothetical protein
LLGFVWIDVFRCFVVVRVLVISYRSRSVSDVVGCRFVALCGHRSAPEVFRVVLEEGGAAAVRFWCLFAPEFCLAGFLSVSGLEHKNSLGFVVGFCLRRSEVVDGAVGSGARSAWPLVGRCFPCRRGFQFCFLLFFFVFLALAMVLVFWLGFRRLFWSRFGCFAVVVEAFSSSPSLFLLFQWQLV